MMEENGLPKGWKYTYLSEFGKVITGKTPSKNNPEDWGELIDFITPTEIRNDKKYIFNTPRKLSKLGYERFAKMILPEKSIIVTCIGSDMGKVILNKNKALTNQQINSIIVNNDNYFNFVYYLLKNAHKFLRINAEGSGSTMPILNKRNFENLSFKIPHSKVEQKAIASILTSFDDKIELLQAQNETLEATAQTIFKEWFGKYQVGDELPEGWRVGKLGDTGKVVCGKTPSKSRSDYYGDEIPFIKIPDMHNQIFVLKTFDNLSQLGANSQQNKAVLANSICVSCIATVGLVSLTTQLSHTNQQINSIVPSKIIFREYLYFTLKNMYRYLNDLGSGGTATLNVNTSTFSNIELVTPNDGILNKFHEIQKPLFDKILSNMQHIQTLQQTRDTLLPKLMSGKVRVDEFRE